VRQSNKKIKKENKAYEIVKSEMSKIAYYKWQFLRRNKDYQKDYDSFRQKMILFKKIKSLKDRKIAKITLGKELQKLKGIWCLTPLTDYRKKRPNSLPKIGIDSGPVSELSLKDKFRSDFLYIIGGKEILVPHVLNIAISLSHPKNKILPLIEEMLKERIDVRRKILKEIKQPGFSKQSQLALYKEYLGIWDYVQQKRVKKKITSKEKWAAIAKKFEPDHYKNSPEATIQSIHDWYNAANKLIEGEYKEIK